MSEANAQARREKGRQARKRMKQERQQKLHAQIESGALKNSKVVKQNHRDESDEQNKSTSTISTMQKHEKGSSAIGNGRIREMFDAIDTQNCGYITKRVAMSAFRQNKKVSDLVRDVPLLCPLLHPKTFHETFHQIDADDNQQLDFEEFSEFCEHISSVALQIAEA